MKILLIDEDTADEIVAFFHGFCSAESTNCSVGVLAREGGEGGITLAICLTSASVHQG